MLLKLFIITLVSIIIVIGLFGAFLLLEWDGQRERRIRIEKLIKEGKINEKRFSR